MRSSSDTIAQLAAALAKAQIELVNPAKTLTAIIDRWGIGNEGQTYRYAPLSAGLDIVRNTLCKHELAVIQTTHVDRDSGMVLLTTTLAHGSGEWICATWPVCRTADMTNPKLMGAALTYARRYGLFTLVGIAGDDDLDAPELPETVYGHGIRSDGAPSPAAEASPSGARPSPIAHGLAPQGASTTHYSAPPLRSSLEPQVPYRPDPQGRSPARRRRRDAGVPRRPRSVQRTGEPLLAELAMIADADTLFDWGTRRPARPQPAARCCARKPRCGLHRDGRCARRRPGPPRRLRQARSSVTSRRARGAVMGERDMMRRRPFPRCERRWLPGRLKAQIMLRQQGRCADCGTRLIIGFFVFDHRPPLALREDAADANDPERLAAICWTCDQQKTPTDLKEIARTKRLADKHQNFLERQRDKVPGRPVASPAQRQELKRFLRKQLGIGGARGQPQPN